MCDNIGVPEFLTSGALLFSKHWPFSLSKKRLIIAHLSRGKLDEDQKQHT
jgi:hypothetical protein